MTVADGRRTSLVLRALLDVKLQSGALVLETDEERFHFANINAASATKILDRINGQRTATQIVETQDRHGLAFLESLVEAGIAIERPPSSIIGAKVATARIRAAFPVWNQRLFSHALWTRLTSGRASRNLIAGWVLETWHFIRATSVRLPLAIAFCPTLRQRSILTKHFREEFDHDKFFVQSLNALRINVSELGTTEPLPGTKAVIDWMRAAAKGDQLAYAACSGLLESTGSNPIEAQRFYDTLQKHYSHAPGFIEPMRRHAQLDESFGHGHVMQDMFEAEVEVHLNRADFAARTVYGFVETLEQWFTDILDHYEKEKSDPIGSLRRYKAFRTDIGNSCLPVRSTVSHSVDQVTPLISPTVCISDTNFELAIEDENDRIRYSGSSADCVRSILPYLNGTNSTQSIAVSTSISEKNILEHLTPLFASDLVVDTSLAVNSPNPNAFCRALQREAAFWNRTYFNRRFVRHLFSGKASHAQVMGWGIEYYHFIEGANQYMAQGVAHCPPNSPWYDILVRHYAEECDHSDIFLQGLAQCGLDPDTASISPPLASTSALVNRLCEIAVENTVGYAAIFAFMRPVRNGKPVQEDRHAYSALASLYPQAASLFDAFCLHGKLDATLGHGEAPIYTICREQGGLKIHEREAAVQAIRAASESFTAFIEGISRYYTPRSTMVLRHPASIYCLPGNVDIETH